MGRQLAEGHETTPAPELDTGPAPGKSSRTERLPGRTRVPVIDDGTACEREESATCFLTPDQRSRFLIIIANRAGIIGANARDAIADTRLDTLLDDPNTWGFFSELLFYSGTGWMIGGIMRIVKSGERGLRAAENVQATLTNASRGFRKTLQGSAHAVGDHQKASKARFLELVRDGVPLWQSALVEQSTAALDDDGLVALKDALDPEQHTVGEFKAKLQDILARFDRQQIDQVGVTAIYRHGELMWLGRGAKRRLVMLEDHGLHHNAGTGDRVKPRDLVAKEGRDGKPIVIDRDLETATVALYVERTGREPFEMAPQRAVEIGGEIGRLGAEVLVELLTFGGGV